MISDPEKWIIDTNVVVHWLMAKKIMQFAIEQFHLTSEFLDVYQNRYQHSISFVDKALGIPKSEHDFVIVELSLNEIFSGVRDEVRSILLFVKGIPISRWASKRETQEVSFSEELSKNVYELTSRGFDALFGSDKIGIIPATSPSDVETYLEVYAPLVFLHPDLKTQDAILVTTGIFEKTNYFVTTDSTLMGLGKEKEFRQEYSMEIVSPQKASNILTRRRR